MTKFLTEAQFSDLRDHIRQGKASLAISRSVSRQFFLRVSNASIRETTGESMFWQKACIWTAAVLAPLLLILCCLAIIYYFKWFATLSVPLVGMFWTVIAGLTGHRGSWKHTLIGLIVGFGLAAILEHAYRVPLMLFVSSLVVHRINYQLAELFLTRLIGRSFGAYDMLVEHIKVKDKVLKPDSETPQAT